MSSSYEFKESKRQDEVWRMKMKMINVWKRNYSGRQWKRVINSYLLSCSQFNDIIGLKLATLYGADLNSIGPLGNAPIHFAAEYGYLRILDFLTRRPNVEVNIVNCGDFTPLLLAYRGNHMKVFKLLLERGANPNFRLTFGKTLMHYVLAENAFRFLTVLVLNGADLNAKDDFKKSPLHIHLETSKDPVITTLLVKGGADVNEVYYDGHPIISIAIDDLSYESEQAVLQLASFGANVNVQSQTGDTVLHISARLGLYNLASRLILQYGANMEICNNANHTPIKVALLYKQMYTREYLSVIDDIITGILAQAFELNVKL